MRVSMFSKVQVMFNKSLCQDTSSSPALEGKAGSRAYRVVTSLQFIPCTAATMVFLKPHHPHSFLPHSLEVCLNLTQTSNPWSGTTYSLHLRSARPYSFFLCCHLLHLYRLPHFCSCNPISVDFVPKSNHLHIW